MTRVITDPDEMVKVLAGQRVHAIRIGDEIITQIIFTNGATLTGAMLVEGPPADNNHDGKE